MVEEGEACCELDDLLVSSFGHIVAVHHDRSELSWSPESECAFGSATAQSPLRCTHSFFLALDADLAATRNIRSRNSAIQFEPR